MAAKLLGASVCVGPDPCLLLQGPENGTCLVDEGKTVHWLLNDIIFTSHRRWRMITAKALFAVVLLAIIGIGWVAFFAGVTGRGGNNRNDIALMAAGTFCVFVGIGGLLALRW